MDFWKGKIKKTYSNEFIMSLRDNPVELPLETVELLRSLCILKGVPNPPEFQYKKDKHKKRSQKQKKQRNIIKKVDNSEIIKIMNKLDESTFEICKRDIKRELLKDKLDFRDKFDFFTTIVLREGIILELYSDLFLEIFKEFKNSKDFLHKCEQLVKSNEFIFSITEILYYLNKKLKCDKIIHNIINHLINNNQIIELYFFREFLKTKQIDDIKRETLVNIINNTELDDKTIIVITFLLKKQRDIYIYYILDNINIKQNIGSIIKELNSTFFIYYIQKIKSELYNDPQVVIIINEILKFKENYKMIELELKEYLLLENNYLKLPMKWRFKFMDLKELF